MNTETIISIGPLPEWVIEELGKDLEVICLDDSDRSAVLNALDDRVIGIIARGPVCVDREIMEKAPNLRVISRTGVGYDSVSIPDASARRIPVVYTPGAMTRGVAEHALALILSAVKKMGTWSRALQNGDWNIRYTTQSRDLEGSTVGIIGYGRIGRAVRELLRPFNTRVIADDPYINHSEFSADEIEFADLDETLSRSDIVTLHVPLTEETYRLINSKNIHRMKAESILINTARGNVVENLDLLYAALEENRLGAVGLDVFPDEPPDRNHPLFKHPRAFCTGHVAARSPRSQRRILDTMLRETKAVLKGNLPHPENVVNPEVLLSNPDAKLT